MPHLGLHSLQGVQESCSLRIQVYSPGNPVSRKLSQRSEGKERSKRASSGRLRRDRAIQVPPSLASASGSAPCSRGQEWPPQLCGAGFTQAPQGLADVAPDFPSTNPCTPSAMGISSSGPHAAGTGHICQRDWAARDPRCSRLAGSLQKESLPSPM